MTNRRTFLTVLGGGLLAGPLAAEGQQAPRVLRVGYLGYSPPGLERNLLESFRQELRSLGYIEQQNLVIEYRSAEGKRERFPELVDELLRLRVDVIVTLATPAALAAQHATSTIPIVVAAMADPIGDGLVASLARPGGNVTGSTFLGPRLVPKRLELLKEMVSKAAHVAVLWHPGIYSERTMRDMLQETEGAARTLGVQLHLVGVTSPEDFGKAFYAMSKDHSDGVVVFPSPMLYLEHKNIVDQVTRNRLPAVYPWREAVDAGGLVAYGRTSRTRYDTPRSSLIESAKAPSRATCPSSNPQNSNS